MITPQLQEIRDRLQIVLTARDGSHYDCRVEPDRWLPLGAALYGHSRLLAVFGNDERGLDQCFRIYAVFGLDCGVTLTATLRIPEENPAYPALTPVYPAAHWYEREIKDMFGIQPLGHPDPRRLVLHRGWPKGVFPLRKDCRRIPFDEETAGVEGRFPYQKVIGEGIIQVPVGPIHAGIIEPGHFRFHTVGENILELEARLFYTHRGIEKMAEGRCWPEVQPLTERICGVCTVAHSWAFALAVEEMAGQQPPEKAQYLRVIFAELERVYNHLNDISAVCAGVGLALGSQKAAAIKEKALRLNRLLTGHRYLQGVIVPGGVRSDLEPAQVRAMLEFLAEMDAELNILWQAFAESDSLMDRLRTTGVLAREEAAAFGAVGPAARASGVAEDIRRDYPYGVYHKLDFPVPTGPRGDVYSRFWIRFQELAASSALISRAVTGLAKGAVRTPLPPVLPACQKAFGVVESPRGSDFHWLMTDAAGRVYRYFIRSASYPNWPALAKTVPGNIIPDFPLINKSFELCYSCLDR